MKVFLSSTYLDLIEHRKAVVNALHTMGEEVGQMEIFGARDEEATKVTLEELDKCELFVGIYAYRYGTVPKGTKTSVTEQEYLHANKKGIPIFVFIVDDNYPWSPKLIDRNRNRIDKFKSNIELERTPVYFTTPDNLATHVLTSIGRFTRQIISRGRQISESRILDTLVANSLDGIIAVDKNGRIFLFNPMAEEILGYDSEEVIGKSVLNIYSESNEARKIGYMLQNNRLLSSYETTVRDKKGVNIPVLLSASSLYDNNGNAIGSVGYFRDVTQIQETEKQIQQLLEGRLKQSSRLQKRRELDVFVLMPFSEQYYLFYKDVIKKTLEEMNLVCMRADDFFKSTVIMIDILHCIEKAKYLIADFSGRNPNVCFEVGIAHALGKNVTLITQDLIDVPPKLQVVRCHIYQEDQDNGNMFPDILRKAILEVQVENYSFFQMPQKSATLTNLCLCLLPSAETEKQTYNDFIFEAVNPLGLDTIRTDEIFDSYSVLDKIWEYINKAGIIIADLTGRDPDVFYLVGLAYGLKKRIVFITQRSNDIPFDLKRGSSLIYSLETHNNWKASQEKLQNIVRHMLKN